MTIWNTIKELIFGPPLKQQFEELLEKPEEEVKAPVNSQITDAVTQAKPKRTKKKK